MLGSRSGRPRVMRTWSTMEELNYQRRGERGIDYDEYGAEMEPTARVWGVYVEETDKADRELVDGWNGTMDVMLIFAALYSGILTAFVIESSKDLKPDYSEISARALLAISGASLPPGMPSPGPPQQSSSNFVPTRSAVMVNTLWFLSLGLSVAVSLISILAKEWCYSFMTRRTGAKLTQGRLRQKRWDGIKYWKMEEIICLLPLLMHIALLLFAIGLSVYLWNINPNIALPVVLTTILTLLYYIVTAFLPLFFKDCPYMTAVVKLFYPWWTAVFGSIYCMALFQILLLAPAWLRFQVHCFKDRVFRRAPDNDDSPGEDTRSMTSDGSRTTHQTDDSDVQDDAQSVAPVEPRKKIHVHRHEFERKFHHRIEKMHKDFLVDRSQFSEDETPMDQATSSMLLWMITNCEDPQSVNLALQALAGADLWLPVELFLHHEVDFQVLRKLERCLYILESPHLRNDDAAWEELLDIAHLYSRALATLIRGTPVNRKVQRVTWAEWENCMRRMHKILYDNTHLSNQARISQSTDLEFGTLLLEGSQPIQTLVPDGFYSKRRERQWEILGQITTDQVTGIPPSASSVRALVNVITRTLLYAHQSPLPLVGLFNAYNNALGSEDANLAHSIGIALTIARFMDPRLKPVPVKENTGQMPSSQPIAGNSGTVLSRDEHARRVYNKLATKQPTERRTRALLNFGLLGLLDYPTPGGDKPYLKPEEVQSIDKALRTIETPRPQPRKSTLLTREDQSLRYLGYHKLMPSTPSTFDLEHQFEEIVASWLRFWVRPNSPNDRYPPTSPDQETIVMYLEALLSPSRCQLFGVVFVDDLIDLVLPQDGRKSENQRAGTQGHSLLFPRQSVDSSLNARAKKLCIQSISYSITDWPGSSQRHKRELKTIMTKLDAVDFCEEMLAFIESHQGSKGETDRELVPYAMRFVWNFTVTNGGGATPLPRENGETPAMTGGDPSKARTGAGSGCVRNENYEGLWFDLLRDLCDENPKNVLDSGILEELTKTCEDSCYQSRRPLTDLNLAGDKEDDLTTWPSVYKLLRKRCEERCKKEREEQKGPETSAPPKKPLIQVIKTEGPNSANRPEIASPRSEPELPIASGSGRQDNSDA